MPATPLWVELDLETWEPTSAFDRFPELRGFAYDIPSGTARVVGVDCCFPATRVLVESAEGRRWSVDAEALARLAACPLPVCVRLPVRVRTQTGTRTGRRRRAQAGRKERDVKLGDVHPGTVVRLESGQIVVAAVGPGRCLP
jgi:hypothetical protein